MIRRPPRSTQSRSSAASDVYKRQRLDRKRDGRRGGAMSKGHVLAIDQGTTSTRAILFDEAGRPGASAHVPLTQIYPSPGQVEHDADEIWRSVLQVCRTG